MFGATSSCRLIVVINKFWGNILNKINYSIILYLTIVYKIVTFIQNNNLYLVYIMRNNIKIWVYVFNQKMAMKNQFISKMNKET